MPDPPPFNLTPRHRSEKPRIVFESSSEVITKKSSVFFAKVNIEVSKGHQRSNLPKNPDFFGNASFSSKLFQEPRTFPETNIGAEIARFIRSKKNLFRPLCCAYQDLAC